LYFEKAKEKVSCKELYELYENRLESIFPCNIADANIKTENFSYEAKNRISPVIKIAKPKVLIPAFPGTNCEFDSAKAVLYAGAEPEIIVIRNLSAMDIQNSVDYFAKQLDKAQMVFIPGGFSGGDEPDGSGKFITAFFRNAKIKDGISLYAIEGITSPDGRVFGKMGHAERIGTGLYKNVEGNYNNRMFEAAVKYFK